MAKEFQLKALIMGVDKLSPVLDKARKTAMGFRRQLLNSGLGQPISLQGILQGGVLAAPFIAGARAAMEFESSMADVRKVVDFDTPEQFKQMGDDVLTLSKRLPMAARDIAQIVASGGQAGLARTELTRFAEDAVKMGVAFDQTAEESGDMMAKWRTSFRIGQDEVVALADKINYLSNTGPASARQISSIVTKIGPLGEIAGMASGQIAAMGATLAGVGVAEEVAATGMKNFMLTLTAGSAATAKQQEVFKALRLDAKEVAAGMQTDAEGTIKRILSAISKVDPTKQAAVMQQLFGRESIGAIAPMLNNMELLERNFRNVGDATAYAGSMQKEYAARAATTENNLQLMRNKVVALGISVGAILLPPFNDFMDAIGPIIDQMAELAAQNPWLIKGILGAAAGFVALRLAVVGVAMATKLMTTVMSMSPVGLLVRGLALAAGFLIANWSMVTPFFEAIWERIRVPVLVLWEVLKKVFSWTPLGLLIENWGSVSEWFAVLWEGIKIVFSASWDLIKEAFNWTPLGLVIQHWQPIVDWFAQMWEKVMGYIEPVLNAAGKVRDAIGGGIEWAGNAASGAVSWVKGAVGLGGAPAAAAPAAAPVGGRATQAQVNGEMVVRFDNAPPGMRVEPAETNQPGLSVPARVGYRSLGRQ